MNALIVISTVATILHATNAAVAAYSPVRSCPRLSPSYLFTLDPFALSSCPIASPTQETRKPIVAMTSNPPEPTGSLNILCFGDSLTAGYSRYGTVHFPYAIHLKEVLQTAFPSTWLHIEVEGMSGAQVQGQYRGRLKRALEKAGDDPYDWVIIMGGTNDMGWGRQPEDIYGDLRKW